MDIIYPTIPTCRQVLEDMWTSMFLLPSLAQGDTEEKIQQRRTAAVDKLIINDGITIYDVFPGILEPNH